jgi:hypothetical protein
VDGRGGGRGEGRAGERTPSSTKESYECRGGGAVGCEGAGVDFELEQ